MEVEGKPTENEDQSEVDSSEEDEFESGDVIFDPDNPDLKEEALGFISELYMEVEDASRKK